VFGIALAIDGMRRAVKSETPAVVTMFGADQWIVARGASGPFTTTRPLDASVADTIAQGRGVRRADPVVLSKSVVATDPAKDVNLVGHVLGGLGSPPISEGRAAKAPGEAVITTGTTAGVGDRIVVGGKSFRVVGRTAAGRYFFGAPTVFVPLSDAQDIVFKGQPLAMAVAVKGTTRPPAGTATRNDAQVEADLDRPLNSGLSAIVVTAVLMWCIAAGIIGLIVYLSAIERTRDFAVFKATGAPNRLVVGGLMLQSVVVALVSAVLAVGVSRLVGKGLPVHASLSGAAVLQLVVISVVVGVLASLAAVRRAVSTDPAVAFGGQ